jgi:hypothetical protein
MGTQARRGAVGGARSCCWLQARLANRSGPEHERRDDERDTHCKRTCHPSAHCRASRLVFGNHVSSFTRGMRIGPRSNSMDGSVTTRVIASRKEERMNNIFYIIGVVVVVAAVLGYLRLG